MPKLESEVAKETYSFQKLEKWINRQIKSFNGLLKNSSSSHAAAAQTRIQVASLAELDYLLIPVNQRNTHWLMLVVDLRQSQTIIVNSMSTGKQVAVHYGDLINRFVQDFWCSRGVKSHPQLTLQVH